MEGLDWMKEFARGVGRREEEIVVEVVFKYDLKFCFRKYVSLLEMVQVYKKGVINQGVLVVYYINFFVQRLQQVQKLQFFVEFNW